MRLVAIGVVAGLAWSAALRGYMVELAGDTSQVDWAGTFLAILLPGAVTGALLGWAAALRRRGGGRFAPWLALAPLSFAIATLAMPGVIAALLTEGLGGGAVAVPVFAIIGGYALSGRGPRTARVACGVLATLFVVALVAASPFVGGPRLALTSPRGAWAAVLIGSLQTTLALAVSIPFRISARSGPGPGQPSREVAGGQESWSVIS